MSTFLFTWNPNRWHWDGLSEVAQATADGTPLDIDHVCTNFGAATSIETWSGEDGRRPPMSDHPGVVVSLDLTTSVLGSAVKENDDGLSSHGR
jgi:hypothetical protein